MTDVESRTELISRATKAIVASGGSSTGFSPAKNSKKSQDFAVHPDTNLRRVLDVIQNDPVVRGDITTLVDRTLEPGFSFYGKDKKSRQESAIDKMDELRFESLMRPLLQHLFSYNNAFIEIVRVDGSPEELHMIDPRVIDPVVDKHGVVQFYQMNSGEDYVRWEPDEVVHLKTTPLAGSVWGDVEMKALWTACALKAHIKKLYLWQYETNQFRPLLNIQNATDEQIKRFLTFLDEARADIKRLVPVEGEVETIFLDVMQDYTKVKDLLAYLDYEIHNILQVAPIATDSGANRSSSDAKERVQNTRIKSIHRLLEDVISHDLLPELGFEKVTMKFNTIDDKVMKDTLEMAERMKTMGIKTELIKDFLEAKGWDFPEGEIFDEELLALAKEPKDPMGAPGVPGKKSMDMFPSRKGKSEGEGNKRIGTGERGTTRQDQLVARAWDQDKWYYEAEVEDDVAQ